ncbi:MAG: hypothetical protein GY698_07690 [Actinomycetia bacterium]|nr:hypothetical protein [Actinomycetes bacterium]
MDFNNRVKRADNGEYYRVALAEIDDLEVGSRVLASDFEDIEVPVEITALLHREGAAIVRVVRMREFPAVIVGLQGPARVNPAVVRTDSLDSLGVPLLT